VRLDFTNLSTTQWNKLFAWSQLSASRWQGWSPANATAAVSASWQWVQQQFNGGWQFVAASFAQQTMHR
jgi:hypothetical protein